MFELVIRVLLITSTCKTLRSEMNISHLRLQKKLLTLNFNETYFQSLENYQENAAKVSEQKYPWIARVIHSRSADIPHMCTATCIDEGIFITAARCIYTLKVIFTRIIYMSKRFNAIAFVVPSKPSKQQYDDIGFIVVNPKHHIGTWAVIEVFNHTNRTDNVYDWYRQLNVTYGAINHKVVGYAMKKGMHRTKALESQFDLSELSVIANIEICSQILAQYGKIKGYHVPCYHSCTFAQFQKSNDICRNYHGVEGGALFDTLSNKLIGIATWGAVTAKYELPVGFSVANSANYFKDFKCARRIRDDNHLLVTKGYYQTLCNGM